jgi:histidine kinase
MTMFRQIRRQLGWKLFLSYLVVILIGAIVLATAAELAIPRSFNRHMASMGSMMPGMMDESGMGMDLNSDLFSNFRAAVNESLLLAAFAASIAAVVVSLFISRRVVAPVLEMKTASQQIAEGEYSDRVRVPRTTSIDDFDELAQLAVSFNQMAEKLEKTEKMRRELIADVTHELRTPLTAIKGSMEGLMDGVLEGNEQTFQQVYRETDRLQRLVNDLQELSRVEAGAYQLDLQPRTVSSLTHPTLDRIRRQFDEKGVGLSINVDPDLPQINVDEDRISQVLLNLIGNALQYTTSGGEVEISVKQVGNEAHFSVTDTGIGISPEHLPHIFTRFYRVDKSRARASGGSGIGLTIAKHIIEAHGGRIWAESPGPDQGSTFFFTLPLSK